MDNVYAVVEDNIVTNIVMWDGTEEWEPEKGEAFPAPSNVGIGWSYVDGEYIAPPPPFDDTEPEDEKGEDETESEAHTTPEAQELQRL